MRKSRCGPAEERAEFLRSISRFASDHAPVLGRLLTPLVNGVRVAGPFTSVRANKGILRLVLLARRAKYHLDAPR